MSSQGVGEHGLPATDHVSVAVPLPVHDTYTYQIPDPLRPLICPGKRVLVPFRSRRVTGYVTGPGVAVRGKPIKSILDVLDEWPLFPPDMVPFFQWISGYYMHPLGEVIKGALPGGINPIEVAELSITRDGKRALENRLATPLESRVLQHLKQQPANLKALSRELKVDISHGLIQTMVRKGWLSKKQRLVTGRTGSRTERIIAPGPRLRPPGPDHPPHGEKLSPAKQKIVRVLSSKGEIPLKALTAMVPSAPRQVKPLRDMGYATISKRPVFRNPFGESIRRDQPLRLTVDQRQVMRRVTGVLDQGFSTCLLTGVTGSGKTEIYLQAAAEVLRRKKTVLVLVPEIALISQTEGRFRARFGNRVAVLHSGLSRGERFDQWIRIVREKTPIAVGARSAVFAPLANIGLIVVDEEHDTSYKQEGGLRYHARDLAVLRAKLQGCVALLGSATPSVQSCHNAKKGKFIDLSLDRRIENRPLPDIITVDLRKIKGRTETGRFISPRLYSAMSQSLGRGEQVLLFLNRRGYARLPLCRGCGEAVRCPHCDIALTYHQQHHIYKCHYCGFRRQATLQCPHCRTSNIKLLGMGTERLESMVKSMFPKASVARMDRDTTTGKNAVLNILKQVRNGSVDVLIGTQMVAKGHDFPNITLVGIICADLSLNFPDFRSGERTFQLLAQVAGRAGRGDAPGKVILQTYNPDHFSIRAAKAQDVHLFYSQEITFRKALHYPPFSRMVLLRIRGKDKRPTHELSQHLSSACRQIRASVPTFKKGVRVMGPIEAAIPKIADHHRYRILLKGETPGIIHDFMKRLLTSRKKMFRSARVKVALDVDPIFMM